MKKRRFSLGPATLVAAAFIGPGTVTTCTLAGANFGYALVWALVFSVVACVLLQEMSARLGVITRQGLGEVLNQQFTQPLARWLIFALVAVAIFIGNAAYEGGNIAGAALGLQAIAPAVNAPWPWLIVAVAFGVLMQGSYQRLEQALMALVLLMSLAFITTFIITRPDIPAMLAGLVPQIPEAPEGAWLTVMALVGTTVVPYNLFLHASAVSKKWSGEADLPAVRKDTIISIGLGGLISLAIISTAAAAFFGQQVAIQSAADMSGQLEPLLGAWASVSMGVGLFAAGITSSITAPLAAAYAVCGMLGWSTDAGSGRFRLVWLVILLSGLGLAVSGYKPISIILFAQVANGILLPVMALFLLYVMNQTAVLGRFRNSPLHNLLGGLVVMVAVLLGGRSLYLALT